MSHPFNMKYYKQRIALKKSISNKKSSGTSGAFFQKKSKIIPAA
jgi:hypothetical protein